jgi:hypothetical protein
MALAVRVVVEARAEPAAGTRAWSAVTAVRGVCCCAAHLPDTMGTVTAARRPKRPNADHG